MVSRRLGATRDVIRSPAWRNPNDLARALAGDKNLSGADLTGANLADANLAGALLAGANLTDANLFRANLHRATLEEAILIRADMSLADLRGADLTGTDLTGADLHGAALSDAILIRAVLYGADLRGADLRGADLRVASIMRGADLREADLRGADLEDADLEGADLRGADLLGANLLGANLSDANLSDANLTGAKGLRGKPVARGHSYGKASGAVLKLIAEGPQTAREFKRKYPAEFERLKPITSGRDFTRETIDAVVAKTRGARWIVTRTVYESAAQRHCPQANAVLLFNIDLGAEHLADRQRDLLRKLSEVSRRSGHPHERGDKLFTVGWVRYCDWSRDGNPSAKTWLVEEVQSDVQAARFGLKDERARAQLAQGGISPAEFEDAVAALAPWTERFYEDALGVTFALAKQRGIAVEMLTYDSKRGFGSPQAVYADLPRSMGMTRRAESAVLPSHAAWHYRPNGARASRSLPARRRRTR